MREKLSRIFSGRQGMDEFSKALFWMGLVCMLLSVLTANVLKGVFSLLFNWLGLMMLIFSFVRAFSRRLGQREAENNAYLALRQKQRHNRQAAWERRAQRKDFCFFKCPGCGVMLRVPRGKGKIHIKCKCGYTLYRKT
ncbi:MAG: hypothetical protein SPI09_10295 [Candidatus Limivicinus sp.]|nr:hypothetical protein [Clostridiales bacterium]MDY6133734.1 hypothetical protein [Candidatus Limivicinus sp.]